MSELTNFIKEPAEIEKKSMAIIAPHIAAFNLSAEEAKVYSRIIHAAGDVEYAPLIDIHPDAITTIKAALKAGANVFADVEMVRTGINKQKLSAYGGTVKCLIADEQVKMRAKEAGITRAMAAMRTFGAELAGGVVAVGNAPTALFEVLRLIDEEQIRPAAIVGIPVGFVGAAEAKKALAENGKVPFITVSGTKGGSPIAAAVINAVLYQMD